jgi:hypothetical protein
MLYKKVDASSPDSVTTGLDFFTTPPTNCAISNSSYREYLTVSHHFYIVIILFIAAQSYKLKAFPLQDSSNYKLH